MREGAKAGATRPVVALDRFEEADRAFLDEVVVRQAEVAVAQRQAPDEGEMPLDEQA